MNIDKSTLPKPLKEWYENYQEDFETTYLIYKNSESEPSDQQVFSWMMSDIEGYY